MRRIWLVFVVAVALTLGSLGVASAQDNTAQAPSTTANRFVLTDIKPNNGETGVSRGTNVTATFNRVLDPSTVRQNFTLRDLNTGKRVHATITVNGKTATLNPNDSLKRGDTYEATLDRGIRSRSGDRLDGVDGSGATFSGGQAAWRFTVR